MHGSLYRPELDVLRFFAFFAVFIHHALPRDLGPYIRSGVPVDVAQWIVAAKVAGGFGVDVFFALSGYLITDLLLREWGLRGKIEVRAFYVRRALRIWPLYYAFLLALIFVVPFLLPWNEFGMEYAVPFAAFVGNWALAVHGVPRSVAIPLWSVSIEEQFYLVWPPLLRLFGIRRVAYVLLGLIATAWATRVIIDAFEFNERYAWFGTVPRLDALAFGALIAIWLRGRTPLLSRGLRVALICVAVALCVVATRYWDSIIVYPTAALSSAAIVIATLRRPEPRPQWRLTVGLRYLGRISYGLYVFHLLALTVVGQYPYLPFTDIALSLPSRFVLSLALTVGLAAASYQFLELPFLRLKRHFTYVPTTPIARSNAEGVAQARTAGTADVT